jgi:cytochrome P450
MYVIAEMLGVPRSDRPRFKRWSDSMIEAGGGRRTPATDAALGEMLRYFAGELADRRRAPKDDLVSTLAFAEIEGEQLSDPQILMFCITLLAAGNETTRNLISGGSLLLARNPEQRERLLAEPRLLPNAIEEMLRFEPPVQATRRFVTEDLDFHGTSFKRGDQVFVSIAAANRDPRVIDDPETFDIRRTPVKQVSFGYGIHLCIGASLARLETRIAFEILMQRYPGMSLVSKTPQWGTNPVFRGLERLEVRSGTVSEATAA